MNKLTLALVIVATLVAALLTTGQAFAQGTTPPNPQAPGTGYGNGGGPMGGRGMRGGGMVGNGILHDAMIAVYAQELGISVDDLNTRMTNGETMAQIATEKGLTVEEFRTLMVDARSQAIDQAVKDGTLTQEQADWMKQRGTRMNGGAGRGRGMRGANAGTMECPYFSQTNP